MKLKPIHGAVNIPFSRQYETSDAPAKDIGTYLKRNGHEILDSKEDFSVTSSQKRVIHTQRG